MTDAVAGGRGYLLPRRDKCFSFAARNGVAMGFLPRARVSRCLSTRLTGQAARYAACTSWPAVWLRQSQSGIAATRAPGSATRAIRAGRCRRPSCGGHNQPPANSPE